MGPVTALAGVCLQYVEGAHEGGKRLLASRLRPVSSKATHPPTYLPLHTVGLSPGAAATSGSLPLPACGGGDAGGHYARRAPPVAAFPPVFAASPGAHVASASPFLAAAAPSSPRLRAPPIPPAEAGVERHSRLRRAAVAAYRLAAGCGNKEGANKYPVATLAIQKRRTQRVDLPRGPRRRKGAQGLGLERDAKI